MCNCSDTDIESGNELFHAQTSSYVLVVHVLTFKTKSKNSVGPRKVEWVETRILRDFEHKEIASHQRKNS